MIRQNPLWFVPLAAAFMALAVPASAAPAPRETGQNQANKAPEALSEYRGEAARQLRDARVRESRTPYGTERSEVQQDKPLPPGRR
jgi:hypothetical protein